MVESGVPPCTKGLEPLGTFPKCLKSLCLLFHSPTAQNILSHRCSNSALVCQGGHGDFHPRTTPVRVVQVIQDVPHELEILQLGVIRHSGVTKPAIRLPCTGELHLERMPMSEVVHLGVYRISSVSTSQARHHLSALSTRLVFPSRRMSQQTCALIYADPRLVQTHCTIRGFYVISCSISRFLVQISWKCT